MPAENSVHSDPLKSKSTGWAVALGLSMVFMPLAQGYFALQPTLELTDFLPASMIVDQVIGTLALWNAPAISGLMMVVGGVLLIAHPGRWAWIFGVASLSFAIFNVLETLLLSLWPAFQEPKSFKILWTIGLELLEMTYYTPVIFFLIQVVGLVLLLRPGSRSRFQVARREFWIMAGMLGALLLDLHISLLVFYLSNQS